MDLKRLLEHWQDEGESAYLYKILAEVEPDPRRRNIYLKLADVELKHQQSFAKLLAEQGVSVGAFKPGWRTRLLGWMARRGGARTVLRLRIVDEASEVKNYLREKSSLGVGEAAKISQEVARDEAIHAETLMKLAGSGGEPWHRMESGGFLRNVVYGFNDGLTANFGLVMGVLGAQVHEFIVLSGLAGLVADALSMGASGYLAAKSEQEVYQHEIELEREEIQLMPEVEAEELALLYEAKGMPLEVARQAAAQVMADPQIALQEKAREELGISPELGSPLREGILTGTATAFGALIPVIPFFFGSGPVEIWTSFTISMLSHFAVGAARSLFTGRGVFRSGLDMFLVGLGVAIVGYFVGMLIEHL
ncbi:MAG: VIT1/CCC1 transporter family protein [Candidatus Bipolaricaulota bacterium]|nr:VIT1/CCC1 transporter family protein [Candidatus Bipolaricaulota bacterium]